MTKIKKKSSKEIQNWTVTLVYILQLIDLFYFKHTKEHKFSLYKQAFIEYNIGIKNLSTQMFDALDFETSGIFSIAEISAELDCNTGLQLIGLFYQVLVHTQWAGTGNKRKK